MSATTVKLLQAAAEIAGGNRALAHRLGIGEALLSRFLSDRRELPDALLLRAVDIVLEHRPSPPGQLLADGADERQNRGRGNGDPAPTGTGRA